ncbi:MAG: ABC transporter permease [Caldilineaceae bacterium]|nr:ABC transporter permease [Caldilineaceae bacterium]
MATYRASLSLPTAAEPTQSHTRRSLRAFFRSWVNWIALLIIVIGFLMAITPKEWLPHDPTAVNPALRLQPPSLFSGEGDFLLGTDTLGRDILSRSIYAARWTYLVSVSAVVISTVLGTMAGLSAGYFRGWLDTIIARLIDMQLAFPIVLLSIAVLAVSGPSLLNMILVLGLVDWARYARVVRGSALSLREEDFVDAARATGATSWRIMMRHILPNILSSIVVLTTFSTARLMLTESALSFLGLGVTPPATTWGSMIGGGRDYILQAWWISAIPGTLITLTVLAINLAGDGLRDAFDPRGER